MAGILFGQDASQLLSSVDLSLRLRKNKKTLNFVECGCARGDTSVDIIDYVNKSKHRNEFDFKYYGIDSTDYLGKGPTVNRKEFIFVKGYTFEPSVIQRMPKDLDWIFIDGCHCAMCVKRDTEIYAKLLSQSGVMAFHDASPLFQGAHPQSYGNIDSHHNSAEAKKGIQVLLGLSNTPLLSLGLVLWRLALPQKEGGVQIYVKNGIKLA